MKDNMQAKLNKKLMLHKETIRALTAPESTQIVGGRLVHPPAIRLPPDSVSPSCTCAVGPEPVSALCFLVE